MKLFGKSSFRNCSPHPVVQTTACPNNTGCCLCNVLETMKLAVLFSFLLPTDIRAIGILVALCAPLFAVLYCKLYDFCPIPCMHIPRRLLYCSGGPQSGMSIQHQMLVF